MYLLCPPMKTETTDKPKELQLDVQQLKKGSLVIRALKHKLRQQILKLIHSKGSITVTEIYVKLRIEQSVASQHLAILRKPNIVTTKREGKKIFYSINYQRLTDINKHLEGLIQK